MENKKPKQLILRILDILQKKTKKYAQEKNENKKNTVIGDAACHLKLNQNSFFLGGV